MSKNLVFSLIALSVATILLVARLATKDRSPYFEISKKEYWCSKSECHFVIDILNSGNETHEGILVVKAYAERDLPQGAQTQDVVASTSSAIELAAGELRTISGKFVTAVEPTSIGAFINEPK